MAKLTVLGRRLVVDRILVDGMAVAHAADMAGVSRQTAWKWLRRFEAEGDSGARGPQLKAPPDAAGASTEPGRRDSHGPPPAPLRTSPSGHRSLAVRAPRSVTCSLDMGCLGRGIRPGRRDPALCPGPTR